jgi:PHD/YefM family antitoxin component YafN of YafNO toxin-antitoxin module
MVIPEVLTVREAREKLPSLLGSLGGEDAPVFIGAHRKPQGVLISLAEYERLVQAAGQDRRAAVESAAGSLRAEGLTASEEVAQDAADYAAGRIDADELRRHTLERYQGRAGGVAAAS